jgi:Bifunctional DNA primase/polymerase, N-terminal/Primase C terminal 1 (PriCT-1)
MTTIHPHAASDKPSFDHPRLVAALAYARRGWPIFPLHTPTNGHCTCGKPDCKNIGKHPRTPQGLKDASTDEAMVRHWWTRWPQANLGGLTGATSGVIVLDVDPRHGGNISLEDLEAAHGKLPDTVESQTGGGRHVFFKHPGVPIRNDAGKKLGPGLDIRGDGGYIVLPPSLHASGRQYEWEVSSHPDDVPLAPMPPWLMALLTSPEGSRNGQPATTGGPIPEGARNVTLTSLAGAMRQRGMTTREIYAALITANADRCTPPLPNEEVRGIAASIGRYDPAKPETAPTLPPLTVARRPQHTRLIALGLGGELFRTPEGQPYARVRVAGHEEVMAIGERGSSFRSWLANRFHAETGTAPSSDALSQALEVLRGKALFGGRVHEVHTRFAPHGQALYLDLANDAREVVEITADGWRLITQPPVYFRRPGAMRPLPRPDRAGTMADLHRLINVPAGSAAEKLIDGWLVHVLMPHGSYSPLCIHGEQGSAKSTLTKMLRSTLDPNRAPARSAPKDERDLAIMAVHSRIVALENLSSLPDWLSDALCCLSTGAGFSTRKLYADDEEVVFAATRPVILNGIAEVAVRGDLIDRCTFVTLAPLGKARVLDEQALWAAFHQAHPRILGAVLRAACTALKRRPTTRIDDLPRMADYALWVEAAAPALGWTRGGWLAAYRGNRHAAVMTELEASPVAPALLAYLDAHGMVDRMLMGELLAVLTARLSGDGKKPLPPTWPRSAQSLGAALKRLSPALRSQGIELTMHRHTNRGTPVSLTLVPGSTLAPRWGDDVRDDVGGRDDVSHCLRHASPLVHHQGSRTDDDSDELLPHVSGEVVSEKPVRLVNPAEGRTSMRGWIGRARDNGDRSSPSSPPPPHSPTNQEIAEILQMMQEWKRIKNTQRVG